MSEPILTPQAKSPRLPAWGSGYELEKDRCRRVEAENRVRNLPREPWSANQSSPSHLDDQNRQWKRKGGHVKEMTPWTKEMAEWRNPMLPYHPSPRDGTQLRPQTRKMLGFPAPKRLDHALPRTRSAWDSRPAPSAVLEPFVDEHPLWSTLRRPGERSPHVLELPHIHCN
mmetsp:Transcript_9516/g.24854  ORF Transcript_9516/g.24854 Transcript_9516/m.24854 type:complete len:170 (+) Transcript_9516:38-547(+)